MTNSARIASNVLGTPWPILWGTRDLSGTLIAWTNHSYSSSGSSGKGGGQVSAGDKDYRTFALGLCIGPVDAVSGIWFDNRLIWTGMVTIASAVADSNATQAKGSVILTDNNNRGTIAFFFGFENQDQDPALAKFIPDAPYYRGMCYAVFHGPRNGTKGFRMGNADTLPQIAVRVTRIPKPPAAVVYTANESPWPGNASYLLQPVTISLDVSQFAGSDNISYRVEIFPPYPLTNYSQITLAWTAYSADDTSGNGVLTNGVPFAIGTLGLNITVTWPDNSSPLIDLRHAAGGWTIQVTSNAAVAIGGANVGSMVYELLTNTVAGVALNPAIIDRAAFAAFSTAVNYVALHYVTTEKADVRGLLQDILKNVQGALTVSNGLVAPRLMGYSPGTDQPIALTLEADDVVSYRIRPGAWYEIPRHVTVKYRDSGRFYRDTIASLAGAGDTGNDAKQVEIDLPMVTDLATARLIGLRMKALESLPKKPDTLICGRAAFAIQFGDIIALNNPVIGTLPAAFGYQPGSPLVVLAVREHGPGDELIELDVAPNVLAFLPVSSIATGTGGTVTPIGPAEPYVIIEVQDVFEFPAEWATDGSKRFCMFAARTDPDAQGFTVWASSETPAVDYNEVDINALFCAGGTISDYSAPRFTMDREAYIEFTAASDDIDAWQSVSDNGWFGMEFLVLLGGDDSALLFAAQNLDYIGSNVFRISGLWGPLSDTIGGAQGEDIWVFAYQPPYNVSALPNWINGAAISFKGIPFGSRLSPTLAAATAAQHTVSARALRPRMAQNARANAIAGRFNPTYTTDIALSWDLCNRLFGFGAETNPCEFDPSIASEVQQCQVDVIVGSTTVRTAMVSVRGAVATTVASAVSADVFSVASTSSLQPGDRISVVHAGGEWFGRIASIVADTITLVSALAITPSASDVVNRYESVGYVYDQATNEADNSSLPAAVTFNIYPYMNGLRALNPATITVTKS
jgi:hypothetical protein